MLARSNLRIQNVITSNTNTREIRESLIRIANANNTDAALRAILMAEKDNLGAAPPGLNDIANLDDINLAELQELQKHAKEQAILKTIATLNNVPGTNATVQSLARAADADILSVLQTPNAKINLGLNTLNNFDGMNRDELLRIKARADLKAREFRVINSINLLEYNDAARDALQAIVVANPANAADIRDNLLNHSIALFNMDRANATRLLSNLDRQLPDFLNLIKQQNKVFNAMHAISVIANDADNRRVLALVGASDPMVTFRGALRHPDNKRAFQIDAIDFDAPPSPTDEQLRPLRDFINNQSKTFTILDTINNAAPALIDVLRQIHADPSEIAIKTVLNTNAAQFYAPPAVVTFNTLSDQQIAAIYTAAGKKFKELEVLRIIPSLPLANNTLAVRQGLLAIQSAANDGDRITALQNQSRTLTLGIVNFAGLENPALNRIRDAAGIKYKQFQALDVIASFNDPANNDALNRLRDIAIANHANLVDTLNAANAHLVFGIADFTGLQPPNNPPHLNDIRTAAERKFKEMHVQHRLLNIAGNTLAIRNALAAIKNAGNDNDTITALNALIPIAAFDIRLPAAFPSFANLENTQLQAIRAIAARKHKELVILDTLPTLLPTNDAARNTNLRNALHALITQADKITVLNTNRALFNLPIDIADYNDLRADQLPRIVEAATLKYKELHAIHQIESVANDPAVRDTLRLIGRTPDGNLLAILNANKNTLGLVDPFDFNGLNLEALRRIKTAATSKNRELRLLNAIDIMDTPDGAGDRIQALVVLNGLNVNFPDNNIRRATIRRFIYNTLQVEQYIDPVDFGLDGTDATDLAILTDDLVDRVHVAAQEKIRALRPLAEPDHDNLARLRAALLAPQANRDAITAALAPIVNNLDVALAAPAPNLRNALTSLNAQLAAPVPPPAAADTITPELARTIKNATMALDQHLVGLLRLQLDRGMAPDNALLALVNTHTDRLLAANGLSVGHPLRNAIQELRTKFTTVINGPAPALPVTKQQLIQDATNKFKAEVEKHQLLALTQIIRSAGKNFTATHYADLEMLLPHLNADDGLRPDHALKEPTNFLEPLRHALEQLRLADAAIAAAGAAPNPALITNKNDAQRVVDASLSNLRTAIKDLIAESRENKINVELEAKAKLIAEADKKRFVGRIAAQYVNLSEQVKTLERAAEIARESRSRDKLLPDINKRAEDFKLSAYLYRESLEREEKLIPLTFAQTALVNDLDTLLTPPDPAAVPPPAPVTNIQIRTAVINLLNALPANHYFRESLETLRDQTAGPPVTQDQKDNVAALFFEHEGLKSQNLNNAGDAQILADWNVRLAQLRNRKENLSQLISRADTILAKSERAEQKPIKIGSSDIRSPVQSSEVRLQAEVDQLVNDYIHAADTNGIARLQGNMGKVAGFNADTHAKITYSQIQAKGKTLSFSTEMLNVASIQKNDELGRHVSEIRFDPKKIGFFTPTDTFAKWAISEIDIYIRNAEKPPKFITIVGDLPEKLVWQMMLYCQHKGLEPVNKTKHSELDKKLDEVLKRPANERTELIEFASRAKRLFPNNPEIYQSASVKKSMDRVTQPPTSPRP